MSWEASIQLLIPFHDVDAMGLVWHGHYFKYFELARTALLQQINYDYPAMCESGYLWPIIECKCRYTQPITYGMTIEIHASLAEYKHRLKIEYAISDTANRKRLTRGYTIQVAIRQKDRTMCLASPQVLLDKLGISP